MADFINMNGYALYVWGAYGVAAFLYGGLIVYSIRKHIK